MAKREPLFDFTPLAQRTAALLLIYFIGVPVFPLVAYSAAALLNHDDPSGRLLGLWYWPVPVVFPIAGAVLLADLWLRLRRRAITTTQVVGHRAATVCMLGGSLFGLEHWWIPVSTAVLCLAVLLTPRTHASPSARPAPTAGSR